MLRACRGGSAVDHAADELAERSTGSRSGRPRTSELLTRAGDCASTETPSSAARRSNGAIPMTSKRRRSSRSISTRSGRATGANALHVPEPAGSAWRPGYREHRGAPGCARSADALRWPLSRLQTGILALALLDTILVGWRSDVVRALPQTASFYSLARPARELARSRLRQCGNRHRAA